MVIVDDLRFALTLFAALGCGLMVGLFFAFSVSVMKALARLPVAEGVAAIQTINIVILNPVFLTAFLGTAVTCVILIIVSLLRWHAPGAIYLLVGGVLYLVGSILVTAVFNMPMNDTLASVALANPDSAHLWASYLSNWTAWNHIRTVATLAAAASLAIGLCLTQ